MSLMTPEPDMIPLPEGASSQTKTSPPEPVKLLPPRGEPLVTLHVDDWDVKKVLEMLSRQANVGMIISQGISGKITMNIQDKTLDDVLAIITKQCRLTIRHDRDMIFISTLAEVRAIEEDNLPMRMYRLNYVKSSDLKTMIEGLKSPKGKITCSPDSQIGLMSGSVGGGGSGGAAGGGGGGGGGGSRRRRRQFSGRRRRCSSSKTTRTC